MYKVKTWNLEGQKDGSSRPAITPDWLADSQVHSPKRTSNNCLPSRQSSIQHTQQLCLALSPFPYVSSTPQHNVSANNARATSPSVTPPPQQPANGHHLPNAPSPAPPPTAA